MGTTTSGATRTALSISASTWRRRTATCEKRFALRGVQSKRMASNFPRSLTRPAATSIWVATLFNGSTGGLLERARCRFASILRGFLLATNVEPFSNNTLPRQSQHFRVKHSIFASSLAFPRRHINNVAGLHVGAEFPRLHRLVNALSDERLPLLRACDWRARR